MITIFHNTRCSKSRQACSILEEKGVAFEVIDYIKNPPSQSELTKIVKLLGVKPFDIVRRTEELYKSSYKGTQLTDKEWIEVMVSNPILIERPIVINGNKAVVGRPPELVLDLL
ncbi:MAG: arsenate reductase (glutaredoxin) [Bacteroidetes bacterium]|nr:arsenate reductase (glutaredoxin) [Bacteroidota bacterium]